MVAIAGFTQIFQPEIRVAASASGPATGHTAAPGEQSCTRCHGTFPVNSGPGNITITGIPANYLPGQQVPVTVTVSDPSVEAVLFGFQMTAVDSQGRKAGDFTFAPQTPPRLQTDKGFVGGNFRQYIEHTVDGIIPTMFGTNSWQFTWTAPNERVGKIGFYAAGNAANSNGNTQGDRVYTTSKGSLSGSAISNFDSDGKSDVAVYRPSTGFWYELTSTGQFLATHFGIAEDKIAPGDYDGDGKTDHAVFRPSTGMWYQLLSSGAFVAVHFGETGDIPVPGDYDGDLKTDVAVYRPTTGFWYILGSTGTFTFRHFGEAGDKIAQADYDADGKTDVAVYRPSNGFWYVVTSRNEGFLAVNFGIAEDKPVQGDYDSDGRADFAVFRPSNATWYVQASTAGFIVVNFGVSTDRPAPADFDGDGKTDIAVYRPETGFWYILGSAGPTFAAYHFGEPGDIPVPAGYLAQ